MSPRVPGVDCPTGRVLVGARRWRGDGQLLAPRSVRRDADRPFVRVAAAVLVLSFIPDIALLAVDPTATPLAVVVLMAMHAAVAAASVGLLVYWRTGR